MKKLGLLLLFTTFLFSSGLKVGDTISERTFKDQFGNEIAIDAKTKEVIAVFSKETGEVVKSFLNKNDGYLQKKSCVYLADMSQVPGFVLSFFMMPKFKDYSYKMALIKEEKRAEYFPKAEDKITVIKLNNYKVEKIDFVSEIN